jgi:hypothetical protein
MPDDSYHDIAITGFGGWICVDHIAQRLLVRLCHGGSVVCCLYAALRQGLLRGAQGCGFRLIERHEWDGFDFVWSDLPEGNWILDIVEIKTGEPVPWSLHIWEPDYIRHWVAEPETPVTTLTPEHRAEPVARAECSTVVPTPSKSARKKPRPRHPDWLKILKRWGPIVAAGGQQWPNAHIAATEILKADTTLTIQHNTVYCGIPIYFPECIGLESKD